MISNGKAPSKRSQHEEQLHEREAEIAANLAEAEASLQAAAEELAAARRRYREAQKHRDALAEELEQLSSLTASITVDHEDCKWSSVQPWSKNLASKCKEYFNVEGFRPNQEEAMNAILLGHDVFLVAPTGAGKSLCFQAPALVTGALTVVISPLLALMHDQVTSLRALGICASMLSSGDSREGQAQVRADMKALASKGGGALRVIYLTPERLAKSKLVMSTLEQIYNAGRLALIAIDEAHCISQWGHDFRPDYERLAALRVQFPKTPILAITATATPEVAADVRKCLGITHAIEFRSATNRPNLQYMVRLRRKAAADYVASILEVIHLFPAGTPGIVYCISRKEAEQITELLASASTPVRCAFYHGELTQDARERVQTKWVEGEILSAPNRAMWYDCDL